MTKSTDGPIVRTRRLRVVERQSCCSSKTDCLVLLKSGRPNSKRPAPSQIDHESKRDGQNNTRSVNALVRHSRQRYVVVHFRKTDRCETGFYPRSKRSMNVLSIASSSFDGNVGSALRICGISSVWKRPSIPDQLGESQRSRHVRVKPGLECPLSSFIGSVPFGSSPQGNRHYPGRGPTENQPRNRRSNC